MYLSLAILINRAAGHSWMESGQCSVSGSFRELYNIDSTGYNLYSFTVFSFTAATLDC